MAPPPLPRPARRALGALIALASGILPVAAAAAPSPHPPVTPVRTAGSFRIDGLLDEPEWADALVIDDFLQQLPLERVPPSNRTEVRVLYDDETLYLAFRCYDSEADRIEIGTLLRDNFAIFSGDNITFAIDSTDSGRDGYWFSTNPGGAQSDAQVVNEGQEFRTEWDGIWESAGSIDDEGWTVEIRLPFFNLQFPESDVNVMRINFFRDIKHRNEEDYAPYIPRNYPRGTQTFSLGRPYVFEGIRLGRRVQLKPYGLVSATGASAPGMDADTDTVGDAGVDLKWAVTPSFTADFTVNPDFAQAEADEVQINLTRFPLFFPERREFFLENAGLFSLGREEEVQAFFSRRIGLDEDGVPVPLLGGARLTGRKGPWSVGVLDVVADETPDEPRTNFFVGRVRRDVGQRSSVGAIVTDRRASGGLASTLGGGDGLLVFHEDHIVKGFAMASNTSDDTTQWAGEAAYNKQGDLWRWEGRVQVVDEGFAPGVGFVRRPGVQLAEGGIAYRPRPAKLEKVRQFEFQLAASYLEARVADPDRDGRIQDRDWFFFHVTNFESGDRATAFYRQAFERLYEPFEIYPGVTVPAGDYDNDTAEIGVSSFDGRRYSGGASVSHGAFYGGTLTSLGLEFTARFNRYVTLSSRYRQNRVRLPDGDFDTNLWINEIEYAFTSTLFGTVLLQWNDVTDDIDLNFRFRWRHHPGSDLFIVYNESRNTNRLPGEPISNFRQGIVKLTWAIFF